MQTIDVPVLIVGAGPIGLSTSLFLAQHGIRSLVVERHPGTSIHPRARGINMRTMELFKQLGLERQIRAAGKALADNHLFLVVESLAGTEHRRFSTRTAPDAQASNDQFSPTYWCMCAQDELEPILVSALHTTESELRFSSELVSFEQDDTSITARIKDRTTGREYAVCAQYMVAADGASGSIRTKLNIAASGRGTLSRHINTYFRADLSALVQDRHFILCFVDNPEVQGVLVSVNNSDRWLLNIPYSTENDIKDFTPAYCTKLVRKAIGIPDIAVEILGILPWEAAVRVADSFQQQRIFLAGDAAHVMPPNGAFGMNTGVQDAHNLAWKLATVLHGQADPALLATYDAERRPVAYLTTTQAGLRSDNNTHRDQTTGPGMLDDVVVMLGYQYRSTAIIAEDQKADTMQRLDLHGQPGTRAPHVWLERQGKRISTLDLFTTHFVLLTGPDGVAWRDGAAGAAASLGILLDFYKVGPAADLIDPSGDWCAAYGISPTGATLVRPDGFVAWHSVEHQDNPQQTLETVLKHLLRRDTLS